ncbi:hypothetical protein E2C01_096606 [Portunus trituberculatus]|uniref:Uncharacterized protein n=1 Tax=Portunus trituberculatus TaxID=210409 RepID=A0A5B7K388_PORTR|nr:hypothetical protein [Portunus trituberculatus]
MQEQRASLQEEEEPAFAGVGRGSGLLEHSKTGRGAGRRPAAFALPCA